MFLLQSSLFMSCLIYMPHQEWVALNLGKTLGIDLLHLQIFVYTIENNNRQTQ